MSVCVQALLAAGQSAKASVCLRVLLESSLEAHQQDVLVLLFLVKAGFQSGSIFSLQTALTHARSGPANLLFIHTYIYVHIHT